MLALHKRLATPLACIIFNVLVTRFLIPRDRRGRGSLIYNYLCNQCLSPLVSSNPVNGDVYSIQHYVIKFVSDLPQVGDFFPGTPVSSTNKTDHHDITEILLTVALNTMKSSLSVTKGPV